MASPVSVCLCVSYATCNNRFWTPDRSLGDGRRSVDKSYIPLRTTPDLCVSQWG